MEPEWLGEHGHTPVNGGSIPSRAKAPLKAFKESQVSGRLSLRGGGDDDIEGNIEQKEFDLRSKLRKE
jgi:hypothetical protein